MLCVASQHPDPVSFPSSSGAIYKIPSQFRCNQQARPSQLRSPYALYAPIVVVKSNLGKMLLTITQFYKRLLSTGPMADNFSVPPVAPSSAHLFWDHNVHGFERMRMHPGGSPGALRSGSQQSAGSAALGQSDNWLEGLDESQYIDPSCLMQADHATGSLLNALALPPHHPPVLSTQRLEISEEYYSPPVNGTVDVYLDTDAFTLPHSWDATIADFPPSSPDYSNTQAHTTTELLDSFVNINYPANQAVAVHVEGA